MKCARRPHYFGGHDSGARALGIDSEQGSGVVESGPILGGLSIVGNKRKDRLGKNEMIEGVPRNNIILIKKRHESRETNKKLSPGDFD